MRSRVLAVDGEQRRAADMVAVLTAAGYEVSAVVETQSDLYAKVREIGPDVIIIDMDSPDRDLLERAKGIIMKQRGVSEEEAYHALRKLAMNRNQRIAEVAENVIAAAELLG